MLTIKQILDDKAAVVRGLQKKCFPNAEAAIDAVLAADERRREAQKQADDLKAEMGKACATKPKKQKRA